VVRIAALAVLVGMLSGSPALAGDKKGSWDPIPPADLALKDNPDRPGDHAILLFREFATDDVESFETHHLRIKIFTAEGTKHADIQIPFVKGSSRVEDIVARTDQSDGRVVPFTGKIFESLVAGKKGVKVLAKTLTLPDVQAGSIIEYKYTRRWESYYLLPTDWKMQHELFTRRAAFSLRPYPGRNINWLIALLPPDRRPRFDKDKFIRLEMENLPPLEEEDFMPPDFEVTMGVRFFYIAETLDPPDVFWKKTGKERNQFVEDFMKKKGAVQQEAARLVSPSDTPEVKLRKLYARVQQVRNLSHERDKTEKEEKREKLKDNDTAEDVLKHGYGYHNEINRLFVSLARAAGLDAGIVWLSERDEIFFKQNLQIEGQLTTEVVLARLGGKDLYLDPGTRFCPFGHLRWERTGVKGIRLDKEGGEFVSTPQPVPADSVTERKANLRLEEDGTVEGSLLLTFLGHTALRRRLGDLDSDETERRKDLEDEVKDDLPSNASVTLLRTSGWDNPEEPLTAEYSIRVPGLGALTGRRMLVPAGFFHAGAGHPLEKTTRNYPVNFTYPCREIDHLSIQLPDGYRKETLPPLRKTDTEVGLYESKHEADASTLKLNRLLEVQVYFVPIEFYPQVRQFFGAVRTGDEDQLVLQVAEVGQTR